MTENLRIKLQCPIPGPDFDTIRLGHGSGGLMTQQLLNDAIFAILQNELLDTRHDGAVFELSGKLAFSTDSYVVTPIFFPGGDIGELAVNGTVNDLAMCGAMAKYLSLSFIIEEGLPMDQFLAILHSIRRAADKAGVGIVTGDTKVVEKNKGDQIFINTSGIGVVHPGASIGFPQIRPEDAILVSGNIAEHGIAIMSKRKGLEFETDIQSDTRPLNKTIGKLLDIFGPGIHFLRDATRGGLAGVLNEIAKDGRTGVEIRQQAIPLTGQAEGACEMLGLDPLYVGNEGVFVAIVDAGIAAETLSVLQQDEYSANAAILGKISTEHPGQVLLQSAIGGRRVVNLLPGEQLPRIC
jgi:hydrogenase expression/formation protein HypE